jgi:hypothetical protein
MGVQDTQGPNIGIDRFARVRDRIKGLRGICEVNP